MSTYAPRAHLRRPHVSLWLISVIGLAAAVVALGSWVLVDRYAGGKSAEQRAGAFIDELTATWTSGDAKAIAALYKSDAVLVNSSTDKRTVGSTAIGRLIATELGGWEAERSGPALLGGKPIFVDKKSRGIVIRAGRHPWFATAYIWHWTPSHGGYFVAVFRILDGQVEAQWNAVTLGDATATPVFAPTGFFP